MTEGGTTMAKNPEGPQRPRSLVVGNIALNRFNALRRQEWVENDSSRNDYGWDLFMGLEEKGMVLPEDFLVQVKGTDKPKYIEKGTKLTFPLETSTIKWLLRKPQPSMLAVCDTQDSGQPVYWVWLNDAVPAILQRNPQGLSQKTLNIHVPVENALGPATCQEIQDYVIRFHGDRRITENIGQVLLPSFGARTIDDPSRYRDSPASFLTEHMGPLVRAGVLEPLDPEAKTTIEALDPQDQRRFQLLRDVESALRDLRERDALAQIEGLEEEIANDASDYVRAKYHRIKGRLFQNMYRFSEATGQYENALVLRPKDPHCQADLLHVQFALAWETGQLAANLPGDWTGRVDKVLGKVPEECRLVRLKAVYIGQMKSPKEAEDFLRNSVSWEREPRETLGYIAHIYSWAGDLDRAEQALQEATERGMELDAIDWSLYGHVFLKKAFRKFGPTIDTPIYGAGPAGLDLVSLRKSAEWYAKAYRYFAGKGFPTASQETVVNYVIVLRLLGETKEGIGVCRSYLDQHPEDGHVHSALAACLLIEDNASAAVPHAKRAFEAEPESSLAFMNLASCLCQAEEYEELVSLVEARRRSGFRDKNEEGISLILAVIGLTEIGECGEAEKWVTHLESDGDVKRYAPIARATLYSKLAMDKAEVYQIFRTALKEYPRDPHLLTHFVAELLPLRSETASEIVSCLAATKGLRQLAPHEYHLLAKGLLLSKAADEADKVLAEANDRYPDHPLLLTEWVNVKTELGDEEQAYQLLMIVMDREGANQRILYDLAVLAANTGRLDAAIKFFERAEGKAADAKEHGIIHRYLFQLRMERGDDATEILRHVVKFGKTVARPEEEAAYLTMFMVAPKPEDLADDVEVWIQDFQDRLKRFTSEHPDFRTFKSITIPEDIPEDKKGLHLMGEIWALRLPHALATAPLRQSARVMPWPLVFRAAHMRSMSVFRYWSMCVQSSEFEDAIHIFNQGNDLRQETEAASTAGKVCVDITALLTLAETNRLDVLTECFDLIILARGTRQLAWTESSPIVGVHPLAEKISVWIEANQSKIRVRHAGNEVLETGDQPQVEVSAGGILLERKHAPLNVMLPGGVGESLLLAEKLGIPLYSDESCVRQWATSIHGIRSFSTLDLARSLVEKGKWTLDEETVLVTDLIGRNFREVPFSILHLNSCLRRIVQACKREGVSVSSDALRTDDRMWLLMRRFGDSAITEQFRVRRALDWWLSIIGSDFFERTTLGACMSYPTDSVISPSRGSILVGRIPEHEPAEKAAELLTALLWNSYNRFEQHTADVWFAIKDSTGRLSAARDTAILTLMPKFLFRVANSDLSLTGEKKIGRLYDLISRLPDGDKEPFVRHLVKNAAKLS
jgi:tetratricopeptide (TPR) repeat protein